MNKTMLLFSFFSLLIFSTLASAKNPVEISLSRTQVEGLVGGTASIDLMIVNNEMNFDRFQITTWPTYTQGISSFPNPEKIDIASGSSEVVKLYFAIPECSKDFIQLFNVTVISTASPSTSASQQVSLKIIGKGPICLTELTTDKEKYSAGDNVDVTIGATNVGDTVSDQYFLTTLIKKNEQIVQTYDDSIIVPIASTQKFKKTFLIPQYDTTGFYSVEAKIKDNLNRPINELKTRFFVGETKDLDIQRSASYGFLLTTTMIKIKNVGNVQSKEFFLVESTPDYVSAFISSTDSTISRENNRISYNWYIPPLAPGEEKIIRYDVNLWGLWVGIIVALILGITGYNFIFAPKILKRHHPINELTIGKEVVISLDVKNHSRHHITDIYVRDIVPAIAKVVDRFDSIKPVIRRLSGGTELVWKLEGLRPREERILTYRIKPAMEIVGTLKLPNAWMRYADKKKVLRRSVSKSIVVKPRIIRSAETKK